MGLAEVKWCEVKLSVEYEDNTRGTALPLPSMFRVGAPIVLDAIAYLRKTKEPDATVDLLSKTSEFYYVRIPLSIQRHEKVIPLLVSIKCDLSSANGTATAFSMQPLRVEHEMKAHSEAALEASLKIGSVEFKPKETEQLDYIVYQPEIEAFNLGTNEPAWELRPTESRTLGGVQVFHLIVQGTKGIDISGEITLSGRIKDNRGFFPIVGRVTSQSAVPLKFAVDA